MAHLVYRTQEPESPFSALNGLGIGLGDEREVLEVIDGKVHHTQDDLGKVCPQDFLGCPKWAAVIVLA